MKVFMQHEECEGKPWGLRASVTAEPCRYVAELEGENLGTFKTLDEAKAAIAARMFTRFGLIPA